MAKNKDIDPLYVMGWVLWSGIALVIIGAIAMPVLVPLMLVGLAEVAGPDAKKSFNSALSSVEASNNKQRQLEAGYQAPAALTTPAKPVTPAKPYSGLQSF